VSRLGVATFAALAIATVGAFFVTQHLKVSTPLIAGTPAPDPAVINPVSGTVCHGVDNRVMRVSFYLLHRSDDVDVYMINQGGEIVATLATNRHMRRGVRNPDGEFSWNGHEDNGTVAPDGVYYIKVDLIHQGRSYVISNQTTDVPEPVTVKTVPPHPVVTNAEPHLIPDGDRQVTIHYTGNDHRGGTIVIYRTDLPGRPRILKSYLTRWNVQTAKWDGTGPHERPAPAGVYLVGLDVTDAACNTGRFPPVMPPPAGTTPGAGVTVRYLAAEPPLDPVPAGSAAPVYVDARGAAYQWSVDPVGGGAAEATGDASASTLRLTPPAGPARLYQLDLRSGPHKTAVPLIASAAASAPRAPILVVLPALTWQGLNPVDDDNDGLPDTLAAGDRIELERVLADGLPSGFADEAGFLSYLDKAHLRYDLTTDLGLIDGTGPQLAGHAGVVFAGTEKWLPRSLRVALRGYVASGGHVLSLGIGSMLRGVTIVRRVASRPTAPAAVDALGARPQPLVRQSSGAPITVIRDDLGIFSASPGTAALSGYSSVQPTVPLAPPARIESAAGASTTSLSIVGYQLGRGLVIDIGLPGFGSSLAHNAGARALVKRVWAVLGG
jgi:hypothetical protein